MCIVGGCGNRDRAGSGTAPIRTTLDRIRVRKTRDSLDVEWLSRFGLSYE